jgi:peptidoglycan hydrolase-like protein with peptidoglycan-binding domain
MATAVEPFTFDPPTSEGTPPKRRRIWLWVLAGLFILLVAGAAGAAIYVRSAFPSSTLGGAPQALARVQVAGWDSKLVSVRATGTKGVLVPISHTAKGWILPKDTLAAGEKVHIYITVKRPSWAGWLVGSEEHKSIVITTPRSVVKTHWIQTRPGKPVQVRFDMPVRTVVVYRGDKVAKQHLARPRRVVSLPSSLTSSNTGSIRVASAARTWEDVGGSVRVTWFPTGAPLAAVLQPALGRTLTPLQPLTLRFSRPLDSIFTGTTTSPTLSPSVQGTWTHLDDHTLEFTPAGTGYPLGHTISVVLPKAATVTTKQGLDARSALSWHVPDASQRRLEQLLAEFGYMPLKYVYDKGQTVAADAAAQLNAAVAPPKGHWTWRFKKTPKSLQSLWKPGVPNTIDQGALIKFQNDHALAPDGVATPETWSLLLALAAKGNVKPVAYTYVEVSKTLPETMKLWRNGKVVVTGDANTGIAAAPTPNGTWPVYAHLAVTTMSGLNPDGTPYHDPGIPWVSYFHGGDALHAFPRGSYGVPQSLGCVELELATAAKIWPQTTIGTLVTVHV